MTANISQLKSIYSYLQQSGIGAVATSSNDNYMNTIWSSLQDFETIANGDDQQKAAGIQNVLNKVLDLISTLGGATNETSKAKSETARNSSDARRVEADAEQVEAELAAEIEKINTELEGHIAVVTTAVQNIEGKQEELKTQLEALQTIQEQIQQKQEALKGLDKSSPDYQKQASTILNDIKTLAGLVPAITNSLTGIQESFETESQNVANAYTAVETLKGNAVEIQTNGQEEIVALAATASQEVGDNTKSNQKAVVENIPTSEAAQKAGQAASSNMFTAAEAPKLFQTSVDQKVASTTRISGSANNFRTIEQGVKKLNSTNDVIIGFGTNLETQLNTFNTAIGQWDSIIQPMIESIGSINYEEIGNASEELVSIVEEDLTNLPIAEETENNDGTEQVGFKTSNFDLSKLGIKTKEIE